MPKRKYSTTKHGYSFLSVCRGRSPSGSCHETPWLSRQDLHSSLALHVLDSSQLFFLFYFFRTMKSCVGNVLLRINLLSFFFGGL